MERKNKRFLTAFTVVELLTAVAIVALLIGILLPAMTYVRNTAKETMQKAQLNTIELALTTFKNDYGDYPPSDPCSHNTGLRDYCGAYKLAEALLGWDLLGFHLRSAWRSDGLDENGGEWTYDPCRVRGDDTLHERKGPYLELASANAFTLRQLFGNETGTLLNLDRFVLCDVFGVKKITLANGETVKAGTPILYYRANTSSKTISDMSTYSNNIYDCSDNYSLIARRKLADWEKPLAEREPHPLREDTFFYGYIQDPKVAAPAWPYRPDSYILISAGVDGLYGTDDDITNF